MITILLTPQGKERIELVLPRHVRVITEEMSALTPEEQVALGRLCRKLGLAVSEKRQLKAVEGG
jgi:DNA-binding MarR family transcriptional regulator